MNEEQNELTLLRQAIARLSDRMEGMEQRLRALDRVQSAAKPAESALPPAQPSLAREEIRAPKEIPAPKPAPQLPPLMAAPIPPAPRKAEQVVQVPPRQQAPLEFVKPVVPPSLAAPSMPPVPAPKPAMPPLPAAPVPAPVHVAAAVPAAKIEVPLAVPAQIKSEAPRKEKPRRNIELNIGQNWLNKIGIGIFVLGVGFLIAYSSRYFGNLGPWGKILTGYLVSAGLFFLGRKLKRNEKMINFGYVLTGGGWALAYFTTFALQHFPQSRVIQSEGLDLLLLAGVAAGMLVYSLKYRSEALSGVAIFVGYATATIGDVRFFTLLSCAIESVVILVLVYRFKWLRMLFMGILMTYGAHFLWVMKNMHGAVSADPLLTAKSFFLLNATFLTLYWAVFTAGTHLLRKPEDPALEGRLSVANVGNALFYFLLLYPDITRLFPDQRFAFVLGLGSAFLLLAGGLYASGRGKLFACDAFIGIALITAAIPIKYMTLQTALIWIAELPLLYYAGLELKSRTIRAASLALFAWIIVHYVHYVAGSGGVVQIMGMGDIPMPGFTAFAAALSFGGVFALLRRAFAKGEITPEEKRTGQALPAAAALFLCVGTVGTAAPQNLTLYLFLDALLVFGWGYLTGEPYIRIYSLLFLLVGTIRFSVADNYMQLTAFRRWAYVALEALASYTVYFLYRALRGRGLLGELEGLLVTCVAMSSGLLVTVAVFRYVPEGWITFTLAGLSALTFGVAYLSESRSLRTTALAGSALVALRFIFVDSFPSAGFADWAVIVFPPLSQAGIYFLYRELRAAGKLPEKEASFPDAQYVLFLVTSIALVFDYVPGTIMTPVFAVMNLVFFAAACLHREKFARTASLFILPVVLCRFTAVDNYAPGARMWPLTWVLGSYYALAWAYKKAQAAHILEEDEGPLIHLVFAAAAFLTATAIWKYAPEQWAAACLALAGLGVFLYGYIYDSQDMRVSGSALLGAALFRAVLWDDYTALGRFLRWGPPAVEASSFGAAYLLYRNLRQAGKLGLTEERVSQALFAGFVVVSGVSILRYCPQYWASGTLAVFAAALFFAGLTLGERFVRVVSCSLFVAVAARALLFMEPYEALGRLRWLPIGAQLAALFSVYLPYRELLKTEAEPAAEKPVPLAVFTAALGLLAFYVGYYGSGCQRPLIFTACYLAFFAAGVIKGDLPLRAAWLPLVPAALFSYFYSMRGFSNGIYTFSYAAAVAGGMYAVYGFSAAKLKDALAAPEKDYLPALCLAAAITVLLSVNHYTPALLKTPSAAAALAGLYMAGIALKDDVLAFSAFIFMPYIFIRRLGPDVYTGAGHLAKWASVLAAPAAFLWVHLSGIKSPRAVLKDAPAAVMACAGIVPGVLLLLHALFFYAQPSIITMSLGVAGLAFFLPGFRFKDRALRYSGLLLFGVAVVRIGVVDIADLPIIYKIFSFILLGLILLGVSYVYTRFMSEEATGTEK